MKTSIGLVLILSAGLSGCAPPAFDANAEAAALLKRDAEWSASTSGNDIEKIISYWSDDAVVIPQGEAVVTGKAALREMVTHMKQTPGFTIHWKSEKPSFSPDGKVAYMRGANEVVVTGPDGKPMTIPGRGLTVWRKEADGVWRCVMDTWNDPPKTN